MLFDIREIDAWGNKKDGYEWNTSYHLGELKTNAKDEKKAFTRYLNRKHGITFYKGRTLIVDDCEIITIIDRKTQKPLFAAIPMY